MSTFNIDTIYGLILPGMDNPEKVGWSEMR